MYAVRHQAKRRRRRSDGSLHVQSKLGKRLTNGLGMDGSELRRYIYIGLFYLNLLYSMQYTLDTLNASAPETFRQNSKFIQFMADAIGKHALTNPALIAEVRQPNGFVYILDKRTPTPEDRVGPPSMATRTFETQALKVAIDTSQVCCHMTPNRNAVYTNQTFM